MAGTHLLAGGDVLRQLDLGEVALPDGLEEAVFANLLRAGAGGRAPHRGRRRPAAPAAPGARHAAHAILALGEAKRVL